MRHWLLKTDPAFSFDDLLQAPIRPPLERDPQLQARNFLRDQMEEATGPLYHSSDPGGRRLAECERGYPDPTQFIPRTITTIRRQPAAALVQ